MTSASISSGIVVAAACLFAVAGARWHSTAFDNSAPLDAPNASIVRSPAAIETSDDSLAEAEDLTASNDPFRLSNTPSSMRYDPAADGAPSSGAADVVRPIRPALVLKAIVGGPPWRAVIDGIPGQPSGVIVEQGNKFERLVVRSVTRDSVIVQAPDTSWVLSFRKRS